MGRKRRRSYEEKYWRKRSSNERKIQRDLSKDPLAGLSINGRLGLMTIVTYSIAIFLSQIPTDPNHPEAFFSIILFCVFIGTISLIVLLIRTGMMPKIMKGISVAIRHILKGISKILKVFGKEKK